MNLFAEYAEDLNCLHCGAKNRAEKWPEQGDLVPFYNQKEPGQYTVTVHCPNCNKDWYVVWDDNPGAIRQLELSPTPTASPQPAPDPAKAAEATKALGSAAVQPLVAALMDTTRKLSPEAFKPLSQEMGPEAKQAAEKAIAELVDAAAAR